MIVQPISHSGRGGDALWVVLIAGAAVLGSLFFACATPFAALAAVAGARMRALSASATVVTAWIANQAIGFGMHHYPVNANSLAWGGVIGVAALGAMAAARSLAARLSACNSAVIAGFAFLTAFCSYESVLYLATWPLASGTAAFSAPIIGRIAAINGCAFLLLLAVQVVASLAGLPLPSRPRPVASVRSFMSDAIR